MFTYRTHFDSIDRIWYGNQIEPTYNYNVSIGQVLLQMLKRDGEKVIQISDNDGGRKLTANEFLKLSIKIAKNLQKNGLQQNDVIGLIAENSYLVGPLALATFICGTPLNALDTAFNEDEIQHLFKITKPKIVFCDVNRYVKVKNVLENLSMNSEIFIIDREIHDDNTNVKSIYEFLNDDGQEFDDINLPKLKNGGDQIAAILCSSGSTGMPKGISVSHAMILNHPFRMSPDNQIMFSFSPFHWISGIRTFISSIMYGSLRIITNQSFRPELALELIEKYQITWFVSSPTHMTHLVECEDIKFRNLSSLKNYSCGGDLIPKELITEIQKYLKNCKITVVYGMSEIAGSCTTGNILKINQRSAGVILNNFQIKIINENDEKLNRNENGEICVKPPYKILGYYGNELATKECIDDDGWYHTDDIGYFDDNDYLYLIDRRIDEIKYKNHYIWTSELESIVHELPQVSDVCAFGIRNLETIELPAVAVVLKKNSSNSKIEDNNFLMINKKIIMEYVERKLPEYKHLRGGVYFVDKFPLTTSGKIIRKQIRDNIEKIFYENRENIMYTRIIV